MLTGACSCMVSHAFHWGPEPLKLLQYLPGLEYAVPKIVKIGTNFVKNIVDSDEFNIKLPSVRLSGITIEI